MNIIIEPTREIYDAPINGVKVPVRIWRGRTEGGVPIEAYVLSITSDEANTAALQLELPGFMVRSRDAFTIDIAP